MIRFAVLFVLFVFCFSMESLAHADQADFTGTWDTRTEKGSGYELTLLQDGIHVTGTYAVRNGHSGHIDGIVDGNVLQFRWEQDGGPAGSGQFALSDSGYAFRGVYRSDARSRIRDANLEQGVWSGIRKLR